MIDKLNGLSHLKVSSNLKRDQKNSEHSEQHNSDKKQKKEEQETSKEHFNVSPFDTEKIIHELNNNKYYLDKEMSFEYQSNHDGDTVIVKKNDSVIQRLTPSKAYDLVKRISANEGNSPIKGGILNIKL